MKNLLRFIPLCVLVTSLSGAAFATTWFPKDFVCPIDNQKNTFMVVGSYGSYIYGYPSKYQWLFFPQTESQTFYICKKCHLTTYMWDFDSLPKDKIADITKALANVKVSKTFVEYTELPITERLEIMERVYKVIGKDNSWWESFYRVKGYHYGKAGDAVKAAENRRRSLELIDKELFDPKSETPRKLLYYISASMKHFLNDDTGSLADLKKALETKYMNKSEKPDEQRSAEDGLNERIKDYIKRIRSPKEKPRLFDQNSDDDH